ncbi:MAG: alpha,alpha-trehalase TreA [Marinoscillum sp.]
MKILNALKIAGLSVLLFLSCSQPAEIPQQEGLYKPWESLGPLFHDVQMAGVFPDSKTFVDCTAKRNPYAIAADYKKVKGKPDFDLKAFVEANFEPPKAYKSKVVDENAFFQEHLDNLWVDLTRAASAADSLSTLIALPGEYVVPGGRFREIYYWDSYFTMIGLGASGRTDLVELMVNNFAYLIDTVGFIPNGNRTYYLGRSQPPFFSQMVNLYGQLTSMDQVVQYLPMIEKEYSFWMQGSNELGIENRAVNRVVMVNDGTILNRYFDFLDLPRPESHKEDFELAEEFSDEDKSTLYRNLRAGAESGWDYSTRWFEDKTDFASIRTTEILPIDLNCLMYGIEVMLTKLYAHSGNSEEAGKFAALAAQRREAIATLFWDKQQGAFVDYIWTDEKLENQVTMATAYPLYFKVASVDQGVKVTEYIKKHFMLPGGLVTTNLESGQQWDYPNGWAPLQWVGIKGIEHYGDQELADDIAQRWLKVNQKVYRNTGKMMEKYNVADTTLNAGGGEYPTQDGFGWTNGVALGLMAEDPVY